MTHETAPLLDHWRSGETKPPLFFCQIEAVETSYMSGAAAAAPLDPRTTEGRERGQKPGLFRMAAKMATGSGKTTVMAMLIAWQTVNAARGRP